MTKQSLVAALMLVGLAGVSVVSEAADETAPAGTSRVRSSHAGIVALIAHATEQSPTFRSMVKAIEATNGIVYVEEGTCGHRVIACLTHVTTGGNFRFLRVRVQTGVRDAALMATIGHELRHAIEVLSNPTLTSTPAMQQFYRRYGSKGLGWAYETTAAVEAGQAVGAELRRYRRSEEAKD
jgi:hypothetical protein